MVEKESHSVQHDWLISIKGRGLDGAVMIVLDVLEPVGPLLAQLLWAMQPLAGIFGARSTLGILAETFDQPGGIESLRKALQENKHDS